MLTDDDERLVAPRAGRTDVVEGLDVGGGDDAPVPARPGLLEAGERLGAEQPDRRVGTGAGLVLPAPPARDVAVPDHCVASVRSPWPAAGSSSGRSQVSRSGS